MRIGFFSTALLCVADLLVGRAVLTGQSNFGLQLRSDLPVTLLGGGLFVRLFTRHIDNAMLSYLGMYV